MYYLKQGSSSVFDRLKAMFILFWRLGLKIVSEKKM